MYGVGKPTLCGDSPGSRQTPESSRRYPPGFGANGRYGPEHPTTPPDVVEAKPGNRTGTRPPTCNQQSRIPGSRTGAATRPRLALDPSSRPNSVLPNDAV